MKKKYTSPTVVQVKLDPEQAILGSCAVGETDTSGGNPIGECRAGCKQTGSGGGDNAATS